MKKMFLLFLVLPALAANAQSPAKSANGTTVRVKEWGSLSVMILPGFFDATKDSIIKQIGEEEFEFMQNHCSARNWPSGIYISSLDEAEDKAHDEKRNRLKKYKIASYTHVFNGQTFERYAILRVPFDENKNWDPAIKWEGNIYFLLNENDIEPEQ